MVRMWTRALLLGVFVLAMGSMVGCAQERAPINQVQPDALAKSFFVGPNLADASTSPEFYMRGTVIDVGYGAAQDGLFTSTYAEPLARIRWEITENYLNARLSYEQISGTDGTGLLVNGLIKNTVNNGQIVASYKITSQFDIRRAYNPTTGEELNIIVENTTDEPWYDRQYMRVDWSQNLASDAYGFDTLTALGWIGGIQYDPLAYTVLNPSDPDAPYFDAATGYFDVTVKAFAKPAILDLSSLGFGINQIPACELPGEFAGGTAPYGDCNPVEITLRYSFKQVVDTDYEPKVWDGYRFQAFGAFTTQRMGYTPNYGMVDALWYRFADRYNIWERNHYYATPSTMTSPIACATYETTEVATGDPDADPNRDLLHPELDASGNPVRNKDGSLVLIPGPDGTSDECEEVGFQTGAGGAQCDIFTSQCDLPYAVRTPVTIPWYVNGATTETVNSLQAQIAATTDPTQLATLEQELSSTIQQGDDIFEATNWAVQEWDLALKTSIQTARLVECKNIGNSAATCNAKFPMWVGQQEDNDEAVLISRDLDICRRNAAIGTVDPTTSVDSRTLEAARAAGWSEQTCVANAQAAAAKLNAARGGNDVSAAAMGVVVPMSPVIVLCHNPVIESDHPACGTLGLSPRLGDLRYHTVFNIPTPQTPSAWGIMVDADDPLTGEKVAASINIWSAVTTLAAQSLVDLVRYANGELTTADITNGSYITNWANASKLTGGGNGPMMSKKQIHQRLAATAGVDTDTYESVLAGQLAPSLKQQILQFHNQTVQDLAVSTAVASPSAAGVQARFQAMHNSPAEAPLLNTAMLQRAGITSSIPQGDVADQASGVALNNPRVASQIAQMREAAMAANGYCLLEEAPEMSSLTGIADAMKRKFPVGANETGLQTTARVNAMLGYVERRYQYAVIAHEMGHSIGLRHNFTSSYAALHYRPQYWQLRTANGTQNNLCTDVVTDGTTCTGPRYWDPVTTEEQSQMIWMFMQSDVMDYPGDVSQDTLGLGAFDFAAARMFYGDVTSIYNVTTNGKLDPAYLSTGQIGGGMLNTTDNFGGLVGIKYTMGDGNNAVPMHYSALQANYTLISNCQTVTPVAPDWWRPSVDGIWDPVFDGHIVSVTEVGKTAAEPTKCRTLPVDYQGWNQLRLPTPSEIGETDGLITNYRGGNAVDPATKRVRVPYSFASDNWADIGNVSVFRHDNGADPYEQMMFLITTQEDRTILDDYRRGRTTFNIRSASDRSYQRFTAKMQAISSGTGFLGDVYQDFATAQGYTFETIWPFIVDQQYTDNMIGATVAFDHFARQLSRPESGLHYFLSSSNGSIGNLPPGMQDSTLRSANDPDGNPGQTAIIVPEGSTGYLANIGFGGHLLENSLATNEGDYDVDFTENMGSYYDKITSAILFSFSEDRFISQNRQDFYDARFRSAGMADILPDGFRRVIGNALTNDRSLMAPHVTADANGVPILSPGVSTALDPNAQQYPGSPIGWTSWWPAEGPTACFPSSNGTVNGLNGSQVCASYAPNFAPGGSGFMPVQNLPTAALDPQIGWEVQKFIIAWTLAYIPADQQTDWVDMMRMYIVGPNTTPDFDNRVEWQDPVSGQLYYAKSYGKECLFGQTLTATTQAACTSPLVGTVQYDPINNPNGAHWVEKGIAARVLEYANYLTSQGYACDSTYQPTLPTPSGALAYHCVTTDSSDPNSADGFDPATGRFHFATMNDGTAVVRSDPTMRNIATNGSIGGMPMTCDTDATATDCDGTQVQPVLNPGTPSAAPNITFCGVNKLRATVGVGGPACNTPLVQTDNSFAVALAAYKAVPDYLWQAVVQYGLGTPDELGMYPGRSVPAKH